MADDISAGARKEFNKRAGMLALVAGIILIIAGVTGAAAWEAIKDFVNANLGQNTALQYAFLVFILVASFGGFIVLIGGVLYLKEKVRTANFLLMLGVGMGLVGVVITLIVALSEMNVMGLAGVGLGFVGIVLSVIARRMAVKVEKK